MSGSSPIIAAIFGGGAQARVLGLLYTRPHQEGFKPADIQREAGIPAGSMTKTLSDLVGKQLILVENGKYGKEYRAPHGDPRLAPIFMLFRQDSMVVEALRKAVGKVKGITYAGIFGSFARGETRHGSDIDLLVLEKTPGETQFALSSALDAIARKTGWNVNPEFYGQEEFLGLVEQQNPVALSIASGSFIDLKGAQSWQTGK